ncbi:conserved Plasmodium protein, unknown function [Plasmodium gallinaceum]|uniref:WD repeat-containing protein 65 n=1 Tax=Plasmodium gallinaceum TaxID=5849 RepID=A0A1J1GTM4_PLAGA|nr:conserved Plasmodium protein, unknown function [Plasmodium gallinaceum]CRG95587.1 conserved Plasmodium protein, unknown function [Plasmodium gallinaceum]
MFTFEKKEETYLTKAIYAYGINKNIYNPFYFLDENSIFYCIGTNGVVHSLLEKKQKFLLSDEKSYGIICLGLSNDKKLLALGEKSIKKPFISIFTSNFKLIKRLTLEISDNESKIMNILFSSKNKYIYCITNGSTKSLFLCYDWIQEKLIFSKIFPPTLFNENCEIYINSQNSSYIALVSINSIKNNNITTKKNKLDDDKDEKDIDSANINNCVNNENKINISKNNMKDNYNSNIYKYKNLQRDVFLYLSIDKNLEEIKIKNKKLEKIDNNFTNCCWLNDGVLLLINKNNYLIFYDIKKEKLKIFNKHISNDEILKIVCLTRGFFLFDCEFIYYYEKSNDLSVNLNYLLKYYVSFNYNTLFNNYCLLSHCENFLYFLAQDGNLKKLDLTKNKIYCENSKNINYDYLRNSNKEVEINKSTKGSIAIDMNKELNKSINEIDENCKLANYINDDDQNNSINNTFDDNIKHDNKNIETLLYNISSGKINDFDVCLKHPLIIICYDDNNIKIINYKKKEIVMTNSFNNEPLHASIHCSGHLLLVAFTDKLRLFHILYNKLKIKKEFFLKNCSCCKFSNGGNFMAVSKISTIYIYKTYTYDLLFILKSHVNYITDIIWSSNDFSIFSIGKDGYLFEYSLYNNGSKIIEVMQKEKKFLSIDLEILNDKNKKKENNEQNNIDLIKYDNDYKSFSNLNTNEIKNIYVSCDDKTIKQYCNSKIECVLECDYVINKILLYKNKFLIASFHNGFFCRIRFYALPLCGLFLEIPCHILNCVNLKLDLNRELLFSCSKDGSIYIFSIEKIDNLFLSQNNLNTLNNLTCKKEDKRIENDREELEQDSISKNKTLAHINNTFNNNDTTNIYNEHVKLKKDVLNNEDKNKFNDCTELEKGFYLSDLNNETTNILNENIKLKNNFLLYDLNNKTNYILNEDEKENDEILIDFFYVQKKNKEVLELQKKITNLKNQMELEMKNKESIYKNEMKKLKKEKNIEINNLIKINKNLIKEKEKIENACKESLYELEEKHTYFVNQLNSQFYLTNKINEDKYLKLEEEFNIYKKNSTTEILDLKKEHQMKINEITKEKKEEIQKKEDYMQNFILRYENLQKEKDEYIKRIEEDVDEEILIITKKYEDEIKKLKEDKYNLLGKFKLYEYIENELKENIQEEKEKFIKNNITAKRLQENIDNLKVDISNLKDNILSKEKEIDSKNKEITNLNKKNEELEKLKIVLTQKIKDLESNLSPKDSEIKIMREKIDEMAKCFENNHKKTVNLQIEINEYKMKIKSLHDDLLNYNKTIGNYDKILKNLQEHIKECYLHLHDKKIFNSSFLNLYNKFHKVNDVKNYDTKNVFSEYIRQKEYLENMIEVLKEKLEKETEAFRKEKIKMMNENSLLLKEINDLKMDLNFLKSECQEAKLKSRKIKFLKKSNKKKENNENTTK